MDTVDSFVTQTRAVDTLYYFFYLCYISQLMVKKYLAGDINKFFEV